MMGFFDKKGVEKKSFSVEGMTCGHCQKSVEDGLNSIEGISSVKVNLKKERANIVFDPQAVTLEVVKKKIEELGYKTSI